MRSSRERATVVASGRPRVSKPRNSRPAGASAIGGNARIKIEKLNTKLLFSVSENQNVGKVRNGRQPGKIILQGCCPK